MTGDGDSVEVEASTPEVREALSLLPDGWSVRRRDYTVVGEWRGYVFVAFGEGGVPRISANVLVVVAQSAPGSDGARAGGRAAAGGDRGGALAGFGR